MLPRFPLLLAALLAVPAPPLRTPGARPETPTIPEGTDPGHPDLLLVLWDGLDPDEVGFLGADESSTPRLDQLAAEALRFDEGRWAQPRGRALPAAVLTGLYPHQNGLYYEIGPRRLAAEGSLGERLATAGYAGFLAGSFIEGEPAGFGFEASGDDALRGGASRLASFVAASGERPLFVLWSPPAQASSAEKDGALGALVDALAAAGRRENTLIAFVGAPERRGLLSGADEREALQRTPLFLVWSGRIAAGRRAEHVEPIDLYPTLLECAGLPVPDGHPGRSLRPALTGGALEARAIFGAFYPPRVSPGSRGGREPQRDLAALSVVDGRWKYALFLEDLGLSIDTASETAVVERSAGDQLLFDLEQDPEERVDLSSRPDQAPRLERMRTAWTSWWRATGGHDFPLPYLPPPLGPAPDPALPNVVLILSDDQDYEHLGFMGNPRVRTPTLDELARAGVVFPVAHVPMSRCRPSQAALLTGRWPQQTGIYDNEAARPLGRRDSLPNLLKAAGYATFQGGKMWEGSSQSMGFLAPERMDTRFLHFVREGQEELFRFIDEQHEERPLFLWWAPTLPHVPHDPPERLRALFRETVTPVPPGLVGSEAEFQEAERSAYAMEAWFDEGLAALCDKLKACGEFENTLFVFLIDNGWANGSPSKGTVFEKGLRTPVFFSWPARLAGGRSSPALVSTLDLPATILDLVGIERPASMAGVSLRPILEGRDERPRETLFGAIYRFRERPRPQPEKDIVALYARDERWKFVLYLKDVEDPAHYHFQHAFAPFPARQRGARNLYDLAQDPLEQHDLAGDPAQEARMQAMLAGCLAWWRDSGGGELDLP